MESDYFNADRELIRGAGSAVTMAQVKEEIRDYFLTAHNGGWLRRIWSVRVSTNRLRRLARIYLPDPRPTFPEGAPRTADF